MTGVDVTLHTTEPPAAVMDGCVAVYGAAFAQPPYAETAADAELLRERVTRYAGRDGFRLVTADQDGNVVAFALAVRAYPGDWWRDRTAEAIGPQLAARRLPPGVLEVVHVAVVPACQRQGIGRAVLAAVMHDLDPAVTAAVLSCDRAAVPAQRLYLSEGWQLITGEMTFGPEMEPRWLMGLDLRSADRPVTTDW
jgi:ribosomal protein S18 acetylase RimI-like enzyme